MECYKRQEKQLPLVPIAKFSEDQTTTWKFPREQPLSQSKIELGNCLFSKVRIWCSISQDFCYSQVEHWRVNRYLATKKKSQPTETGKMRKEICGEGIVIVFHEVRIKVSDHFCTIFSKVYFPPLSLNVCTLASETATKQGQLSCSHPSIQNAERSKYVEKAVLGALP